MGSLGPQCNAAKAGGFGLVATSIEGIAGLLDWVWTRSWQQLPAQPAGTLQARRCQQTAASFSTNVWAVESC
jgi:hypothetical protein